ncbi:MAG: RelA/SpoT family protein [Bacteroidales bacterium]|nr:RelA/SpoT family protein [Bacteroidales bacterium]MCF8387095.1 RelA/SpoT family protein [Bacteroidales bacterium]MCF8397409.1 RelA/SpoT family protein [Bacteroidales bacterium]
MFIPEPEIENKEIIRRYRRLLKVWNARKTEADKEIVRNAFNLAVEAHKGMRRKSGEPYVYHPLDVARIVAEDMGLGTTSIVCALLHDVVEDTDYSLKDIETQFGEKIARIIDGLTKIEEIFDHTTTSIQAENFKKILLTLSDDVRVILIKLADRLHNMRTLDAMPQEKQLKIASETIYLYAPLALRLGLFKIKSELEDLALKYTEPDIYNTISRKLSNTRKQREKFVKVFSAPVMQDLKKKDIDCTVQIEEKSIFSIWEKMKKHEIPFEEVMDIFAVRYVISCKPEDEKVECWKVYAVVTDHYKPNIETLKDWISIPKINGYEALHVTVMSSRGRWVDVQIRSVRMHEIAEKGYVALWQHKKSPYSESGLDEWLNKIRDVLKSDDSNALDFLSDFKMNLFSDEIFLFTPKGDMKTMPQDSTALDFAYNIHTQVGNESIGAKVNHKLVPLKHKLSSGDQVEIITSKKQIPREEWLDFVMTARAKSRIKDAIKEFRKKFKEEGKSVLEKFFNQLNVEFSGGNVQKLQQKVNIPSQIDLYYQASQGNIGLRDVKGAFPEGERGWFKYLRRPFSKSSKNLSETIQEKVREKPESLIIGGDLTKINYEIAACCNPIPGDDVVGFIDKNGNINVHRTNCPEAIKLMSRFGNRIIKSKWRKDETISFLAGLRIHGIDNIGFINELSKIISLDFKLNIRSFHLESSEGILNAIVLIYLPDTGILNKLIERLKKVKEIKKVTRIKRPSDSSL